MYFLFYSCKESWSEYLGRNSRLLSHKPSQRNYQIWFLSYVAHVISSYITLPVNYLLLVISWYEVFSCLLVLICFLLQGFQIFILFICFFCRLEFSAGIFFYSKWFSYPKKYVLWNDCVMLTVVIVTKSCIKCQQPQSYFFYKYRRWKDFPTLGV
jgi:hypothetical protein